MKKANYLLLTTAIVLSSCANLKHVNEFAGTSGKGLEGFKNLPYSRQQFCLDECALKVGQQIAEGNQAFDPANAPQCECKAQVATDQDYDKAYDVLILYFEGLAKLSDGGQFVYKTGELSTALGKAKIISNSKIQQPVSTIADIVLNMATQGYRGRELKLMLESAAGPVDQLLTELQKSNTLLEELYKNYQGRYLHILSAKYTGKTPVTPAVQVDDYFGWQAAGSYSAGIIRQIEAFNDVLEKIQAGHKQLAAQRVHLTDKDLIQSLYTQASQLRTNIDKL